MYAQFTRRHKYPFVEMKKGLRIFGVWFPVLYLIAMSILMEQMFPGWTSYYFSLEDQSLSERVFVVPIIIAVLAAWKLNKRWLPYLVIVQLLVFVPTIFQMIQMLGKGHAHPWLGLAGLYQLVWMLAALVLGLVGRWLWSFHNALE